MKTLIEKPQSLKDAWNILNSLQMDLQNHILETGGSTNVPTKHVLDMSFKYVIVQVKSVKDFIKTKIED